MSESPHQTSSLDLTLTLMGRTKLPPEEREVRRRATWTRYYQRRREDIKQSDPNTLAEHRDRARQAAAKYRARHPDRVRATPQKPKKTSNEGLKKKLPAAKHAPAAHAFYEAPATGTQIYTTPGDSLVATAARPHVTAQPATPPSKKFASSASLVLRKLETKRAEQTQTIFTGNTDASIPRHLRSQPPGGNARANALEHEIPSAVGNDFAVVKWVGLDKDKRLEIGTDNGKRELRDGATRSRSANDARQRATLSKLKCGYGQIVGPILSTTTVNADNGCARDALGGMSSGGPHIHHSIPSGR
ncbi:hypothetical protein C8F01DRAFT_1082987 [Mycena amicta]|nr:hypothetical protein C8F01DRAFT_1082987 [Mycena amicta]